MTTTDHRIPTPRGTLFARTWTPPEPTSPRAPILLFHDSLGSVELWRDFPSQLAGATGRTVIAYDRLGFGQSDPHPGPLPLTFIHDEAATVVPVLCDALHLSTMVLFGHSVGGGIAIATAAHLPDRCIAVITESAQSFVGDRTLTGLHAARAEFAQPGQLDRLAKYHGPKARWVLDSWLNTWLAATFANWSLQDELRPAHSAVPCQVRCPVLALHGDRDEYGSFEHARRIAGLTQGPSQALLLENCGHVPHRENPTRILSEITRFLAPLP